MAVDPMSDCVSIIDLSTTEDTEDTEGQTGLILPSWVSTVVERSGKA